MSRYNCALCSPCKGINKTYCDDCDASCCKNNMKNHREIFYLADQFTDKVNIAENELSSKADEVKKNLSSNYNTFIYESTYSSYHCENFADKMCKIYYEMGYRIGNLNNNINEKKKQYEINEQDLRNIYHEKLQEINYSFNIRKSKIDSAIEEQKGIKKECNMLKDSINVLKNEKENIVNKNVDDIVNSLINEDKNNLEQNYENNVKIIDEKNKLILPILEYTKEEKNLENNYINTINNIKKYSDKIPNFDNWIKIYNLNKYINNY